MALVEGYICTMRVRPSMPATRGSCCCGGEEEGRASESDSGDSSEAGNMIETDRNVGGSSRGGAGHDEGEPKVGVEARAPFPGGPIDGALLKSFKDHVALSIWRNEERPFLSVSITELK
ncbi:hypothetical protein Scep_004636 [Stephania cephalantha]|uniref:Uncharacterized protein n=1 Tax=Stephania cephalantha TaxID=152367 RepID=A0AAP0PVJ9_9MAGN